MVTLLQFGTSKNRISNFAKYSVYNLNPVPVPELGVLSIHKKNMTINTKLKKYHANILYSYVY